jgi:hypothetical protein
MKQSPLCRHCEKRLFATKQSCRCCHCEERSNLGKTKFLFLIRKTFVKQLSCHLDCFVPRNDGNPSLCRHCEGAKRMKQSRQNKFLFLVRKTFVKQLLCYLDCFAYARNDGNYRVAAAPSAAMTNPYPSRTTLMSPAELTRIRTCLRIGVCLKASNVN